MPATSMHRLAHLGLATVLHALVHLVFMCVVCDAAMQGHNCMTAPLSAAVSTAGILAAHRLRARKGDFDVYLVTALAGATGTLTCVSAHDACSFEQAISHCVCVVGVAVTAAIMTMSK